MLAWALHKLGYPPLFPTLMDMHPEDYRVFMHLVAADEPVNTDHMATDEEIAEADYQLWKRLQPNM